MNSGFVGQGLLIQLRSHHPSGCLLSELLQVVDGNYVVRAKVEVDGLAIATAMAAASTIDRAEDQARARVMAVIGLTPLPLSEPKFESGAARIPDVVPEPMAMPELVVTPEPAIVPPPLPLVPEVAPMAAPDDESLSMASLTSTSPKSTKSKAKATKAKTTATIEAVPPPEPLVEITGGEDAGDDLSIEYEFTIDGEEDVDAAGELADAAGMAASPTLDLSDAIAQIGAEIERIGWTKKQGSAYLQEAYGKRTRAELTETELLSFLHYLKALPAKMQPALSDLPF